MILNCLDRPIEIYEYLIDNVSYIDCVIRKKRVVLYPEEKVRQAFILYLLKFKLIGIQAALVRSP